MAPRERRLVGVLAAVALLLGVPRLWRAVTAPARAGLGPVATAGGARDDLPVPLELRDEDLVPRPGSLRIGRDPFRFAQAPPPPPPPQPRQLSAAELAEQERARAAAEAERQRLLAEQARLDAIPKPPAVDLTYLGSFGPETRKIAVLFDGQNIYNALAGDVVGGKFVVDRIGYESVDLKFVGFPDTPAQRLALSGSQ